ncbi:OsmC family protein, partial [Aliarcobacter butzleri]|uniref:OsmC family protein n=1 Tax=Aliarcobacter butzleri TaxID=28197 RepID=UPI001EDA272A
YCPVELRFCVRSYSDISVRFSPIFAINFTKIELKLEGDIDISAVWGTGELTEKTIGFTSIRVKVDLESDLDKKQRDELIEHVLNFSPVTGSLRNPVEVKYVAE